MPPGDEDFQAADGYFGPDSIRSVGLIIEIDDDEEEREELVSADRVLGPTFEI